MDSQSVHRKRIVSIEDDDSHAALIRAIFAGEGYECTSYPDGQSFLAKLHDDAFDLLLVDWELPDMTGGAIITQVRQMLGRRARILVLSSRVEQDVVAAALAAGADDYMSKPIRTPELLARAGALLRSGVDRVLRSHEIVRCGKYSLDPAERVASLDDVPVNLSPREFDLALLLFRNAGCLLSRETVTQTIWGAAADLGPRTLDMYMSRVRAKLALRAENGLRLKSVYAHGVRLELLQEGGCHGN